MPDPRTLGLIWSQSETLALMHGSRNGYLKNGYLRDGRELLELVVLKPI